MKLETEMRMRMKLVKKLFCKCCDNEIGEDDLEEVWRSVEDIFCSENCIARWHGSELEVDDMEELLEDFGRVE